MIPATPAPPRRFSARLGADTCDYSCAPAVSAVDTIIPASNCSQRKGAPAVRVNMAAVRSAHHPRVVKEKETSGGSGGDIYSLTGFDLMKSNSSTVGLRIYFVPRSRLIYSCISVLYRFTLIKVAQILQQNTQYATRAWR